VGGNAGKSAQRRRSSGNLEEAGTGAGQKAQASERTSTII